MISTKNNVEHICITENKLSSIPKKEGQLIYTTDTFRTYWDISNTERRLLSDIVILDTDDERDSILAPLDKFYFIKETNDLWRYTVEDDWIKITDKNRVIDCGGP